MKFNSDDMMKDFLNWKMNQGDIPPYSYATSDTAIDAIRDFSKFLDEYYLISARRSPAEVKEKEKKKKKKSGFFGRKEK
jgi:hypothetical protein